MQLSRLRPLNLSSFTNTKEFASFYLCVLYSGRSTVHAETPFSRICDKWFFHCGPYLKGDTESSFKVRQRGKNWDIWPLQQEDMVKYSIRMQTPSSTIITVPWDYTFFLRGMLGDVLGEVVIGTPSVIDHILFPEVCTHEINFFSHLLL